MINICPASKGPIPTAKLATAPSNPIFLEILGPGVISVINAIKTGLTKPKPIPPNTLAKIKIIRENDKEARIIPIPNIDNPNKITVYLPFTSEIAPENNCTKANGNINEGIVINKSLGKTVKSADSTPNKTRMILPVKGPSAKSK